MTSFPRSTVTSHWNTVSNDVRENTGVFWTKENCPTCPFSRIVSWNCASSVMSKNKIVDIKASVMIESHRPNQRFDLAKNKKCYFSLFVFKACQRVWIRLKNNSLHTTHRWFGRTTLSSRCSVAASHPWRCTAHFLSKSAIRLFATRTGRDVT